jgi:eukaryotic-like serine/threonine-protein kinase
VLVRVLGEGGMGTVFEATHQDLGRRAAVKTLHAHFASSSDVRSRFMREGQAASRVRHPNVVDVYDVGVDGDHPFLVMEFLEGEDLARFLAREGALTAQRTADLLLPVVAAVAAAHDIDVVHRDLKPENIFLSAERGGIQPKVLDFGISKLVNREELQPLTSTGAFLGTPHYMSPEQAQGAKHLDFRSDQYALGVILYQCLTGRRPVEESSIYALMQRIVRGEFPPPRSLNPDLPAAFEALILRAMAKAPSQRFSSTRDLGRALLEFASERLRTVYGPEFSADPLAPTQTGAAASGQDEPRLGTTLRESVQQRDGPRPPGVSRRGLALAAIAAGALAAFLGLRSRSDRQVAPATPGLGSQPALAQPLPSATPQAAPPVIEPSPPPAEVRPPASASAIGALPPAPSADRPAAAKTPAARPVPRAGRPSLAPR